MAKGKTDFPIQDIIRWDVLNWSELMDHWMSILEQLPRNSKVLAIGEREGGLSLWLALMGFDVVCTDITDVSSTAGSLHARYNVADKITYKTLDIVNDEWPAQQFDLIIAKSIIGGLKAQRNNAATRNREVQQKAVHNIYSLLKPGGYFLSAENMSGNMLTRLLRGKSANKGWLHLEYAGIPTLFAPFSLVQIKTFGILPTFFPGKPVNAAMYLLNKYVLSFLPAGSRYIAFVAARK